MHHQPPSRHPWPFRANSPESIETAAPVKHSEKSAASSVGAVLRCGEDQAHDAWLRAQYMADLAALGDACFFAGMGALHAQRSRG
jgi:hypothetical protein